MYLMIRRSLMTGEVSLYADPEWVVLKRKLTELDYFHYQDWDRAYGWEQLREGRIISDGYALWRFVDLTEGDTMDAPVDVFTGTVLVLENMYAEPDGTKGR